MHKFTFAAVVAAFIASGSFAVADDRVLITSVIPSFALAPDPSTLTINGQGFRAKSSKAPLVVFLGRPHSALARLTILEATENMIRVRLDSTTPGTYQLVVSVAGDNIKTESSSVDSFSLTIGGVGAQGPRGLAGAQGPKGPGGIVGAVGPAGATGEMGPQGPAGLAGVQGSVGSIGEVGPAGPQGKVGPTGPVGPVGLVGPKGGGL